MVKVIIRRFLELIITCALISAIAVTINVYCGIGSRIAVFFIAFLGALLWMVLNVIMLRHCYFDLRSKMEYYISNYIAYAIFGMCTVIVYLRFSPAVYGWIFAITKFLKYTTLNVSTVISTAFFHLLAGLMILIVPFTMSWIFSLDEEELEELEEE